MAQSSTNNNQSGNVAKIRYSLEYNFAYCFRPFYYVSRIFGYMPYSIIFDSNDAIYRPAIRVFDILWFIIAIFVYSSMIIINYVQTSNISFTSSKVLICSSQLILFLSIVFGLLVILIDILNRFKFVDILNKFIRIDEKVRPFVQFFDFAFRLSYFSILNF